MGITKKTQIEPMMFIFHGENLVRGSNIRNHRRVYKRGPNTKFIHGLTKFDITNLLREGSKTPEDLTVIKSYKDKCPDCREGWANTDTPCRTCWSDEPHQNKYSKRPKGSTGKIMIVRVTPQFDAFAKACREWAPFFIDDTMKCPSRWARHLQDPRDDPNRFDLKCSNTACRKPMVKKRRRRLGFQWLAPVAAS